MMINRMMPGRLQPMHLIHRTPQGNQLWLGDYYAATNLSLLRQKNIKFVLTAAAMLGVSYPASEHMTHKVINAFDLPSYKMTPHFEQAFQFVSNALRSGNVLVHCAAGISRSTTFVIVYLMRAQGMTCKQAIDYVRSKRSIICPNQGFQKQLKRYQPQAQKLYQAQRQKNTQISVEKVSQDKAVILEAVKDENIENSTKSVGKMNNTVTGSQMHSNKTFSNTPNSNNLLGFRGKSLNYSKKPNQILLPDRALKELKVQKQQKNLEQIKVRQKGHSEISKLTQQFLTFKLENPKIVTIKK